MQPSELQKRALPGLEPGARPTYLDALTGNVGVEYGTNRTHQTPLEVIKQPTNGHYTLIDRMPEEQALFAYVGEGAQEGLSFLRLASSVSTQVEGLPVEKGCPGGVVYLLSSRVSKAGKRYERVVDQGRVGHVLQDITEVRRALVRHNEVGRDIMGPATGYYGAFGALAHVVGGEYARFAMGVESPLDNPAGLIDVVLSDAPEGLTAGMVVIGSDFYSNEGEFELLRKLCFHAGAEAIATITRPAASLRGEITGEGAGRYLSELTFKLLALAGDNCCGGAVYAAWLSGVMKVIHYKEHAQGGGLFRQAMSSARYPPVCGVLCLKAESTVFGFKPHGTFQEGVSRRAFHMLAFLALRCVSVSDPGTMVNGVWKPASVSRGPRPDDVEIPEGLAAQVVPEDFPGLYNCYDSFSGVFEDTLGVASATANTEHWLFGGLCGFFTSAYGEAGANAYWSLAQIGGIFNPFQWCETGPLDCLPTLQAKFADVTSGNYGAVLSMVSGDSATPKSARYDEVLSTEESVELIVRGFNARLSGIVYCTQRSVNRPGATLDSVEVRSNPFAGRGESGLIFAANMRESSLLDITGVGATQNPVPGHLAGIGGPQGLELVVTQNAALQGFIGSALLSYKVLVSFSRLTVQGESTNGKAPVIVCSEKHTGSVNRYMSLYRGLTLDEYNGGEVGYTDLLVSDMSAKMITEQDVQLEGRREMRFKEMGTRKEVSEKEVKFYVSMDGTLRLMRPDKGTLTAGKTLVKAVGQQNPPSSKSKTEGQGSEKAGSVLEKQAAVDEEVKQAESVATEEKEEVVPLEWAELKDVDLDASETVASEEGIKPLTGEDWREALNAAARAVDEFEERLGELELEDLDPEKVSIEKAREFNELMSQSRKGAVGYELRQHAREATTGRAVRIAAGKAILSKMATRWSGGKGPKREVELPFDKRLLEGFDNPAFSEINGAKSVGSWLTDVSERGRVKASAAAVQSVERLTQLERTELLGEGADLLKQHRIDPKAANAFYEKVRAAYIRRGSRGSQGSRE